MAAPSPREQLDGFIDRFTPEIAAHTRAAFEIMRARLPNADVLVYDNYNALAIGFAPKEKTSEAIFSIAVYPRWVSLFFLQGAGLDDPQGLLKGKGALARHIVLTDLALLDDPAVIALMDQALATARTPLDPAHQGRLIIKSISEKQRPRRP